MTFFKKLSVLLFLLGFSSSFVVNAAVEDISVDSCKIYGEADKTDEGKDGKTEEEEEPDCE